MVRQVVWIWDCQTKHCSQVSRYRHFCTVSPFSLPGCRITCELWFQTGMISNMKDERRYISVCELCWSLYSILGRILPATQANTCTINIFCCLVPAKDPCWKSQKEVPDQYKTLALIASGGVDDCLTEGQTLGFMAIWPKRQIRTVSRELKVKCAP